MQNNNKIIGGTAGEINALQLFDSRTQSRWDFSKFGIEGELERAEPSTGNRFDWGHCVADFNEEHLMELAEGRGYTADFCHWLHSNSLIALHEGKIAFPVFNEGGDVISCHYRRNEYVWHYYPAGIVITRADLIEQLHRLTRLVENMAEPVTPPTPPPTRPNN